MEKIKAAAEQLYRVAILWLGSSAEAAAAVTEAMVSARDSGGELPSAALSALIRICTQRAPERIRTRRSAPPNRWFYVNYLSGQMACPVSFH